MAGILALAGACDRWLTKPALYNRVEATVTRSNGDPIPGVSVTLYTGQRPMGYGTTDADGRYVFTRVPQGNYGVFADPPTGYALVESLISGPPSYVRDHLAVAGDTLFPVRFTFLKVGPGDVAVHVVDTDGTPLIGVPVTIYAPAKAVDSSKTDAGGVARFSALPFGVYGASITRPKFYRDFRTPGDSLYATRDNILIEDGTQSSVEFRLPRCQGSIAAAVVDAATGTPVPGTTVVFYTATERLALQVTGADGTTTFNGAACAIEHGVLITPPPDYTVTEDRGSRFYDGVKVTNGATTRLVFRAQRRR